MPPWENISPFESAFGVEEAVIWESSVSARASRPRSQWALIDPGQYRRFNREKINLNDKGATMRSGRPTRESTRSDQIVLVVTVVMTLLRLVHAKDGSRTGPGARTLASDSAACWSFSTSPRKQSVQVPVGLSPRRSPEKRVKLARFSHGALRPLPHPPPPLLFHRSPPPTAQVSFSSRC